MSAITGILKHPGCEPYVVTLAPVDGADRYNALQAAVGGKFDIMRLPDRVDLFVNDEGLNNCLEANFEIKDWQVVVGTAFFAAHDGNGETVSLSDEQVAHVMAMFRR